MKKTLIGLLGSTVICLLSLAGCIDEHYGEKWENNQWINSQMNKWMFMLDDEILLSESDFLFISLLNIIRLPRYISYIQIVMG